MSLLAPFLSHIIVPGCSEFEILTAPGHKGNAETDETFWTVCLSTPLQDNQELLVFYEGETNQFCYCLNTFHLIQGPRRGESSC